LRVDGRKVNRKVLEALVKSGAFDGIAEQQGKSRARIYGHIGPAMDRAAQVQRERESGQTSLLALLDGGTTGAPPSVEDNYSGETDEWLPRERLAYEKESLGFYISGHPLDRFASQVRRFATANTTNAMERGPGAEVTLGGVVCEYQERMAKSGSGKYAFFKLEDQLGQVEFMVGGARLQEHREALTAGEPLLVTGTVDAPFGEGEMVRERIRFLSARPLAKVLSERSSMMEIRLDADRLTEDGLTSLEKLLRQFPGPCRTWLHLEIAKRSDTILELPREYDVSASEELLARVEQLFGDRVAVLR
jgi:DNA polymerase-3 subunit alpha